MMRQFEKLRLDDNFGGGYGQKQRFQAYVYEEYKSYGKFQQEEEEEDYRFGGRHQRRPMLLGDRRPIPRYGRAYKEEGEEEEPFGKRRLHLMQQRTSPQPLKYKASSADEEQEEEEEVGEEEDYRVRLRQYLMQHQGKQVRREPPPQHRPSALDEGSEDEEVDEEVDEEYHHSHQSAQHRSRGRDPASFKLAPPVTPPKNNKLSTNGWRGRQEESQREMMHYEDRLVAPQIITRMVFAKPSPGQSGGGTLKAPERKWMEPAAAAVGSWRIQRGGYIEAKCVRKGLSSNFQV